MDNYSGTATAHKHNQSPNSSMVGEVNRGDSEVAIVSANAMMAMTHGDFPGHGIGTAISRQDPFRVGLDQNPPQKMPSTGPTNLTT